MSYLSSANISMFPSGYRNNGYDHSKLTSEENLTTYKILSKYANNNNFAIKDPTDSTYALLGISGYLFRVLIANLQNSSNQKYIVATIKTGNVSGIGKVLCNFSSTPTSIDTVLDKTPSGSTESQFQGISFETSGFVLSTDYNKVEIRWDAQGNFVENSFRLNSDEIRSLDAPGRNVSINEYFHTQQLKVDAFSPESKKATNSELGLVKSTTTGTTASRDYNVEVTADGTMKVNVPWTDTDTTYSFSSGSTQGSFKVDNNPISIPKLGATGDPTFAKMTISGSGVTSGNVLSVTGSSSFSGAVVCSNQVSASTFLATSDQRLKENIKSYSPQKSILDLDVKKFDFIAGPKNQIGCIAQDLQEICPELVSENSEGYLSIAESKIVYLLLEEVKKLRNEINEIKRG